MFSHYECLSSSGDRSGELTQNTDYYTLESFLAEMLQDNVEHMVETMFSIENCHSRTKCATSWVEKI